MSTMDTSKADDVEKMITVYDRKDELKSTRDDEVAASPVSENEAGPYSKAWTNALVKVRKPVSKAVVFTSDIAAKNPKTSVILGIGVALVLLVIGIFTNFYVEVDREVLWTPTPSAVLSHGEWLADDSGFPSPPRWFMMTVHADGQNVISLADEGIGKVFKALDVAVNVDGYSDTCKEATIAMQDNENGETTCRIHSVTRFWNYTQESFETQVASGDNSDVVEAVSALEYPDGTPVDEMQIMGNVERDADGKCIFLFNSQSGFPWVDLILPSFLAPLCSALSLFLGKIVSAQTFIINIAIPKVGDKALDVEEKMLDNLLDLQDQWDTDTGNVFRLELFGKRSFDDEFNRGIIIDIPLVPLIFVVMSLFTCFVFYKRDWVYSRCMLGFGAVCSVLFSIIFGYGLLFIIGVPFTSMTQVVPFVMFGIGLDDAFIIWGAYKRTDHSKAPEERIHITMEEVGVSIFVTTLTSVVAFSLGSTSSIPAVYWLCAYTAPTIALDFVYQITFFVALIVLDERRVAERKRDCCTCFAAPAGRDGATAEEEVEVEELKSEENGLDRFMVWFSEFLMIPAVKVLVLVVFFGMFGGLAYSASLLEQRFEFTDVLPSPSYVGEFWDAFDSFTGGSAVAPFIVFRDVDQGDLVVQEQMIDYVNAIVALDQVDSQPEFFWLRDFQTFVSSNQSVTEIAATLPSSDRDAFPSNATGTVAEAMTELEFEKQISAFLAVPVFNRLYTKSIVRDDSGKITASRTQVRMTVVDQENVVDQVDTLEAQRAVSERQPANAGVDREDWKFFTFFELYYAWQFYSESPYELMLSTILGVTAVSVISLVFVPHWTSILFVLPIISILYVDLLGFLQLCGIAVNAVSYISLVMSIGLLVDFLLHIQLRYYESKELTREAKVKDTMQTMGTSILIGGISTFLGVLPLVFASSEVFGTIFFSFLGLVVLGMTHGLIFLPVVLSLLGPTVILEL